ncbi:MAG: helix-turn-helix domain-containing protein [Alphaproteobacteria bacterium]|nr:helix-turn-helix domain-containing protein [Alphaproteobacteria bacterium]MBU1552333.1 helix-turn-helix domain-containing protein [Alphaproteobacteria bacterium]MBU2334526.1 helix-turn-helix domain-containing protein [Alphaproteobacteria bacterium]MBU2388336.1 helix-turn-helix domain-containing protein [Alphaproteobacteria bacterium]
MSDRPELPGKADYSIAFRAIALAEGLSGDAKRVAAIILGHFNTKTGQCDPGTERLMSKAKVKSKRTIINATNELHRLGLVVKVRHGGNGFRTRYQPNWTRFREIVEASERDDDEPETVQNGALSKCKSVHLDGANPCTLTNLRNSSKKLIGTDSASGRVDLPTPAKAARTVPVESIQGLLRRSVKHPFQHQRQPLGVVDAHEAARHQLNEAIEALGDTMRVFVLGRITPEIESAALVAEQKSRGAGLRLVVDRVSGLGAPMTRRT